jgi:hypothetical protein
MLCEGWGWKPRESILPPSSTYINAYAPLSISLLIYCAIDGVFNGGWFSSLTATDNDLFSLQGFHVCFTHYK